MLIQTISPLLKQYALTLDLTAGENDSVTLTIVPRGSQSDATVKATLQPICLTGTAAEIDEELARGSAGALGHLIQTRASLADQLAQQLADAEAAKKAAAEKAKAKPANKTKSATPAPAATPVPVASSDLEDDNVDTLDIIANSASSEPASLW